MDATNPQYDGEVLYKSKTRSMPWLLIIAVGLGLGVLFAVPSVALLIRSYDHGWSIGILCLAVGFGFLSIISTVTTINLVKKARDSGVTLSAKRLIYKIDRSRRFH